MHYIYIIKSIDNPQQIYIGYTTNLKQRLDTHNYGGSSHTSKFKPWELVSFHGFKTKQTALNFEEYLKSHSGRAFALKRLWD